MLVINCSINSKWFKGIHFLNFEILDFYLKISQCFFVYLRSLTLFQLSFGYVFSCHMISYKKCSVNFYAISAQGHDKGFLLVHVSAFLNYESAQTRFNKVLV